MTTKIFTNMLSLCYPYPEDPSTEVMKTFKVLGISEEHLSQALGALKKDSQNGTFGAQRKGRSYVLSKKDLGELDGFLKDFHAPFRHNTSVGDFKALYGFP